MSNFPIEHAKRNIVDKRSAINFEEVYICYVNGCFRTATTQLWTVLICDLYYKIEELSTVYNDPKASAILDDIKHRQSKNPQSPDWESVLISRVTDETELLTKADAASIEALKIHRHLSAHPALNSQDILFNPSEDIVRSHIRVVLDAVLTKSSLLTKKIFDTFLEDIESNSDVIYDDRAFKNYISIRYFDKMSPEVRRHILKGLWRVCFSTKDNRSRENRARNARALYQLVQQYEEDIRQLIETDPQCQFVSLSDDHLDYVLKFFRISPSLYRSLPSASQQLIIDSASGDRFCQAPFLSDSLKHHLNLLSVQAEKSEVVPSNQSIFCLKELVTDEEQDVFIDFITNSYGASPDFATADRLFIYGVKPILDWMTQEQIETLVKAHKNNNQCYSRYKADDHIQHVKSRYQGDYPSLVREIETELYEGDDWEDED